MSATPAEYELQQARRRRRRAAHPPDRAHRSRGRSCARRAQQVDDLLDEIRTRVARNERVLVTTLTKRMAEDLTDYYRELGVQGALPALRHRDARAHRDHPRPAPGDFDVLVGINLLREGLDLPEVSLVAILDADKEGFLRSERSLIQTIGRAARNVNGTVILYADGITDSMRRGDRRDRPAPRRAGGLQPGARHHAADGAEGDQRVAGRDRRGRLRRPRRRRRGAPRSTCRWPRSRSGSRRCARRCATAAADLEFERAAELRDEIQRLQARELELRGGESDLEGQSGSDRLRRRVAIKTTAAHLIIDFGLGDRVKGKQPGEGRPSFRAGEVDGRHVGVVGRGMSRPRAVGDRGEQGSE